MNDLAAIEYDKDGLTLDDDPRAVLALPEGLLALEGLPVMMHGAASYPVTQDKVLAAASYILSHRTPEQAEKRFHNQAQVMAYASQEFGWHTGKDLNFASIPNYLSIPKDDEATRQAKAAELDAMIELLNSGLLTTRDGARKLFPDKDVDAIWDRHEAGKKAAVEKQKMQMAKTLETLENQNPQTAKGDGNSQKENWADSVEQRRKSRTNPCLGF